MHSDDTSIITGLSFEREMPSSYRVAAHHAFACNSGGVEGRHPNEPEKVPLFDHHQCAVRRIVQADGSRDDVASDRNSAQAFAGPFSPRDTTEAQSSPCAVSDVVSLGNCYEMKLPHGLREHFEAVARLDFASQAVLLLYGTGMVTKTIRNEARGASPTAAPLCLSRARRFNHFLLFPEFIRRNPRRFFTRSGSAVPT